MRLEDGSRCGLRTIEFCDQDDTQTDEVGREGCWRLYENYMLYQCTTY